MSELIWPMLLITAAIIVYVPAKVIF